MIDEKFFQNVVKTLYILAVVHCSRQITYTSSISLKVIKKASLSCFATLTVQPCALGRIDL